MIDDGECDKISMKEVEMISTFIHQPKTMGREAAAKHLDVSLNLFHELRDLGIIPSARARKGFKELEYFVKDLDECKEKVNSYKNKTR